jgi:hypothetical protein
MTDAELIRHSRALRARLDQRVRALDQDIKTPERGIARLGADVDRYSFIASHHLLLASLPVHSDGFWCSPYGSCTSPRSRNSGRGLSPTSFRRSSRSNLRVNIASSPPEVRGHVSGGRSQYNSTPFWSGSRR